MKALIIAGLLVFSGPVFAQSNAGAQGAGGTAGGAAAVADEDLKFIDMMTQHHQDGQKMAKMAADKGTTKEVKAMGNKIAKDQKKEIDQMKKWRERWYAGAQPVPVEMPKMDMSKLESATGHDFDMAFMDMMTKHHQDGIKMAEESSGRLKHNELKAFAKKTAQNQKSEVAKMEKWRASMDHGGHHSH